MIKSITSNKKKKITSRQRTKNLSLKITLIVDLAMSVVGVVTFSSLVTMLLTENAKTMVTKIMSVVVGVALVGRKEPYSKLQDIETTGY